MIEMAHEVYGEHTFWNEAQLLRLKAFADLVRADERWEQSKRRGVLAFCPYTGNPRHPSDIASDPHGILILVPDQPLRGEKP
jgi:hypothetical protein